jgi:hypothetical protein
MKITRRQFIKSSMLCTAGIAGAVGMSPFLEAMQEHYGIPLPNPLALKFFPTTCLHCNAELASEVKETGREFHGTKLTRKLP